MMVEEILKIIDEAKKRNYSDFILRYDLQNLLNSYTKSIVHAGEESFDNGYECGYRERGEEIEEEGSFDDGKEEGIYEARKEFIELLADKLIELKQNIKDNNLQGKELQVALTEMLLDLDGNCDLPYTQREDQLKYLDEE